MADTRTIVIFDASKSDQDYFAVQKDLGTILCITTGINAESLAQAKDAEVIAVHVSSKVDKAAIEALPNLKLVVCRSTGYDNVDLAAATERGITVSTVPGYGEATVAEYAFMLILALSRKLLPTMRAVEWGTINPESLIGFDLSGKTLGIAGLGRIGKHVAQIGRGFGMKVIAFDVHPSEESVKAGIKFVELDELLKQADVVSLHMPATPENEHIINAEKLALMKPTSLLINTARGSLIDAADLITALQTGKIGGAGLDVVEGENFMKLSEEQFLITGHALEDDAQRALAIEVLSKMPNVIVTSHNAFNSVEALGRIRSTTVENIKSYIAGLPQNLVTKS